MSTAPSANADARTDAEAHPSVGAKRRAVRIELNRAEGSSNTLASSRVEFTGENPWAEAQQQLSWWSLTAPDDGSVDKTDFVVHYDEEHTYSGTFGLQRRDTDLPGHMRRFLEHLLEHGDVYAKQGVDLEEVRTFLAEFEIGRD